MTLEEFFTLPFTGLSRIRVRKYFSIVEEQIQVIDYEEKTINGYPINRIVAIIHYEAPKKRKSKKAH